MRNTIIICIILTTSLCFGLDIFPEGYKDLEWEMEIDDILENHPNLVTDKIVAEWSLGWGSSTRVYHEANPTNSFFEVVDYELYSGKLSSVVFSSGHVDDEYINNPWGNEKIKDHIPGMISGLICRYGENYEAGICESDLCRGFMIWTKQEAIIIFYWNKPECVFSERIGSHSYILDISHPTFGLPPKNDLLNTKQTPTHGKDPLDCLQTPPAPGTPVFDNCKTNTPNATFTPTQTDTPTPTPTVTPTPT